MKRAKIQLKVVAPPGGYATRLLECLQEFGYEVVESREVSSSGVAEVELLAPYGETDEARMIPRR